MKDITTGERVAKNVTIVTFFLAVGKVLLAYITGSLAIAADAFHSFSDLIPIGAAWIGLKIASRPRDERFPFGYYKAENIAAFIASGFILLLAYEIFIESWARLSLESAVKYGFAGISSLIVFTLISAYLARYQYTAAKRINSQALMVNAKETVMDVFSTIVVLVGFIGAMFSYYWADGVVGLLLSVFIAYSGLISMKDSIMALMDAGIPKDEVEKLKKAVISVPRIRGVKSIRVRRSGPFLMAEIVVAVPGKIDVALADSIASDVESSLREKGIDHSIIHVEPPEKMEKVIAVPMERGGIARVFGSAPEFAVYREIKGKRELVKKIKNPGFGLERKRGVKAALALTDMGVDVVEVEKIGKDSREILERAGVKVKVVNENKTS